MVSTTFTVPVQHPAFDGHFPGAPLLPGVVLLDHVLQAVGSGGWTIASAKFLQPVRPGDTLTLEHSPLSNGGVRFTIRHGAQPVAIGTLAPRDAEAPSHVAL